MILRTVRPPMRKRHSILLALALPALLLPGGLRICLCGAGAAATSAMTSLAGELEVRCGCCPSAQTGDEASGSGCCCSDRGENRDRPAARRSSGCDDCRWLEVAASEHSKSLKPSDTSTTADDPVADCAAPALTASLFAPIPEAIPAAALAASGLAPPPWPGARVPLRI